MDLRTLKQCIAGSPGGGDFRLADVTAFAVPRRDDAAFNPRAGTGVGRPAPLGTSFIPRPQRTPHPPNATVVARGVSLKPNGPGRRCPTA